MPASDTTERPGSVPPTSKPRARLTGPGNEAFEFDDLEWIGERDFARQIVVEPPCDAGTDDGEGAEKARQCGLTGPREHGGARHQASHTERDAPVEALMEDEPRHQRGRHTFQCQQ